MRNSIHVVRTPIVPGIRTPIKCKSYSLSGGWIIFPRPLENPPKRKVTSGKLLWCPYCGDWQIFGSTDEELHECSGPCGWATTKDFYVKKYNGLWWEGVPLSSIKKLVRR